MKKMVTKVALLLCTMFFIVPAYSKIRLKSILGDNMVLQQNAEVFFSGTTTPSAKVNFSASWNKGKHESVYADKAGRFMVKLKTPKGSNKVYSLCFDDGEQLCLTNILVGDVWFCSGQSNMEMPVKGFRGQPVQGSLEAIIQAKASRQLRLITVKNAWSTKPQDDGIAGKWMLAGSDAVANFSAVAYFFANKLEQSLDIPIGIINCSWSMSKIEAWMSKDMLSDFGQIAMPDPDKTEFGWAAGTPTLLYNAMVHPWEGFAVKGILWYQGEANTPDPGLYKKLFPVMLKGYRALFKEERLPFYYVQLAPWKSENRDSLDWAYFRQVQLELSQELQHVGMVHTSDLGDEIFIHPSRKREVGERLALWALADSYGFKGFHPTGPVFKSAVVKGQAVEVIFKYGEDGLNPENSMIEGFEIAGEDGRFFSAKAEIINVSPVVKIWSENVSKPTQIRYCFRNYKIGNLTNNYGLPAAPFVYSLSK